MSVCLLTYNQEQYIRQAIESVLEQQTPFPVEIIVGDDHSTDGATDIVLEYQRRHPHRLRVLLANANLGKHTGNGRLNLVRTLQACRGEYIALLEGDDYWTDPHKLQKQVAFLEAHPDFVLSFHNCEIENTRQGRQDRRVMHESLEQDTFVTRDLFRPWFIPSASLVFRSQPTFPLPDWFFNCQSGDIPLLLLLSLHGQFKYFKEVMSVYRLHDSGISVTHGGYAKIVGMIYMYESFNHHTQRQFAAEISRAIIQEIEYHHPELAGLRKELAVQRQEKESLQVELKDLRESFIWRASGPLRRTLDRCAQLLKSSQRRGNE